MRFVAALIFLSSSCVLACAATTETASSSSRDDDLREDAGDAGDASRGEAGSDAGARGTFVDPRDNQSYPTIRIGDKTWLARNLSFVIPGSSFCYGDVEASCQTDGRLYLWSVARTACATGWHLSTDQDWKDLETALGMRPDQLDLEGYGTVRGTNEGTKLKARDGFGAVMAGYRAGTQYDARGNRTYLWTATTRGGDVWRRRIVGAEPTVYRFTNPPGSFAISIRCVAD